MGRFKAFERLTDRGRNHSINSLRLNSNKPKALCGKIKEAKL